MQAIFEWLASNIAVAAVIALVALIVCKFWRNAALLHALWLLVLVKLVTPPMVTLTCLPSFGQPSNSNEQRALVLQSEFPSDRKEFELVERPLAQRNERISSSQPPVETKRSTDQLTAPPRPKSQPKSVESGAVNSDAETIVLPETRESGTRIAIILLAIWLTGSLVWYSRIAWRIIQFSRAIQFAKDASGKIRARTNRLSQTLGVQRVPTVKMLPGVIAPMVWAPLGKAYLLLPSELVRKVDDEQLDALITHELGHLYCRHHWVRRFEVIVTGAFWWCPIVWLARKKLREYEEEICDSWVVNTHPQSAESYANALLDTVDFLSSSTSRKLPPIAIGNSHFQSLNRRIIMILQNDSHIRLSPAGWLAIVAVMFVGLPLSFAEARASHSGFTSEAIPNSGSPPMVTQDEDDWHGDGISVEEIIEEITEELAEMNEEIVEGIQEAREDLREGLSEAPHEVLVALSQMDVEQIVYDAVRDAPDPVRMFVDEVDPAGIVSDLVEDIDEEAVSDSVRKMVRDRIHEKITSHIADLSDHSTDHVQRVRQEIVRGMSELPPSVRQQIMEADLPGIVDEATEDSHAIVKQFVKEVQLRETLSKAFRNAERGDSAEPRDRLETRRRPQREGARTRDSGSDREELERKLEILLEEVDAIRRELRKIDDNQPGR